MRRCAFPRDPGAGLLPLSCRCKKKSHNDKLQAYHYGFYGDSGIRTRDLCVANAALSQLSYIPKFKLPDYYKSDSRKLSSINIQIQNLPITSWAV